MSDFNLNIKIVHVWGEGKLAKTGVHDLSPHVL